MPLAHLKIRKDLIYIPQEGDEGELIFFVKDLFRQQIFRYNELQVAMMKLLDGTRSFEQVAAALENQFDQEVPLVQVERFVDKLKKNLLLDVACYDVTPERARKMVKQILRKRNLLRHRARASERETPAWQLFVEGMAQLERGRPADAAAYFEAVLELNPDDQRARGLLDAIHEAYFTALKTVPSHMVPLFAWDADRFLGWLDRKVGGFVFSRVGVISIALFLLLGVAALVERGLPSVESFHWHDMVLGYLIAYAFIGFCHEAGHGLACKHFGGSVHELGVMLMYGVGPSPYCDVSDSYMIRSRAAKVAIQLAGSIGQAIPTALLTVIWYCTRADVFLSRPFLVAILISLVTFWGNIMPLAPLDAYYALADGLNIPNLRERSFTYCRELFRYWILGIPPQSKQPNERERRIFFVYGIAAALYTTAMIFGLWFSFLFPHAIRYLHGFGLIFCLFYGYRLLGIRVARGSTALARLLWTHRRRIFTVGRTLALSAALGLVVLVLSLRWPLLVDGNMVVQPHQRLSVNATEAGLLDAILVHDGETVKAGQPLARLRNDELTKQHDRVATELAKERLRISMLEAGARPEAIQSAVAQASSARVAQQFARRNAERDSELTAAAVRPLESAEQSQNRAVLASDAVERADRSVDLLRAGTRPEDLAQARAELSRLEAQQTEVDARLERLLLRSDIDGQVVAPHIEDRKLMWLARGDKLCEIHDVAQVYAELWLPMHEPLSGLKPGQQVALRPIGDPNRLVLTTVARIRPSTQDSQGFVVAESAPFVAEHWRVAMTGHARVYTTPRSLAYLWFGVPILQIFDYRYWYLWG